MISRYLVLSGIQVSQTSILVEIQKLASFLLENVPKRGTEDALSRLRAASLRSRNRESSFTRDQDDDERRDGGFGSRGGFRERRFRGGYERSQIFVDGIPPNTSEENIRGVFARFGTIIRVTLHTRASRGNFTPGAGFGFVTFSSSQAAEAALSQRDSIYLNNQKVIKQITSCMHRNTNLSPLMMKTHALTFKLNIEEKKMKPIDGQDAFGQRGGW